MAEKTGVFHRKLGLLICLYLIQTSLPSLAQTSKTVKEPKTAEHRLKDPLPFRQAPIDYFSPATHDRMTQVVEQLTEEPTALNVDSNNASSGYLLSLLELLRIPVESQLLVYSKTALNQHLVSPSNPRAIYFNDDTYVGWVPGASKIEVVSLDPHKGGIYYTVQQPDHLDESSADSQMPKIQRESSCLTCHISSRTFRVPGVLVQSYVTDQDGKPKHGYTNIEPSRPYADRFGGWYVSGANRFEHLGNLVERNGQVESLIKGDHDSSVLPLATDRYPIATSDVAAHLVLHHQIRVHNLLVRVIHESAFERSSDVLDRLCREMLFAEESTIPSGIKRTDFMRRFEKSHLTNSNIPGDPFREFDLKTRVFRNRISFVITSDFFNRIDDAVRTKILNRIWELIHDEKQLDFTTEDRAATVKLIRTNVTNLPPSW